jgi:hypothetical protein
MARGAEAKLRRRNRKKAADEVVTNMFGNSNDNEDGSDEEGDDDVGGDDLPMPTAASSFDGMAFSDKNSRDEGTSNLPKQRKKKTASSSSSKSKGGAASAVATSGSGGGGGGIKTLPLIFLLLMVGTTVLPAVLYAGDYLSSYFAKSNVTGGLAFRLGLGAIPKKRVVSFYEKHAPDKLDDVPAILSKHYGNYPNLIKKLERKYQDYGYFVGWEGDEATMKLALEQLKHTYDVWLQQYWNRYAPQLLKTAFRNIRYNLTSLLKKGRKAWRRYIWPHLQPIFGVPDGAAAAAQKRRDAAEFRKKQNQKKSKPGGGTGPRRRNTEYRDDVESD